MIQDGKEQRAIAGQYILKPRGIFHTFWNAGNERIRFIEFIVPGNFSNYFKELAPFLVAGQPPQMDKVRETGAKYGLIVDPIAANVIIEKYGLKPLG